MRRNAHRTSSTTVRLLSVKMALICKSGLEVGLGLGIGIGLGSGLGSGIGLGSGLGLGLAFCH